MSALGSQYRHIHTGDVGRVVVVDMDAMVGLTTVMLAGIRPGVNDPDESLHVFPVDRPLIELRYDPYLSGGKAPDYIPGRWSLQPITVPAFELDDANVWERLPDTP